MKPLRRMFRLSAGVLAACSLAASMSAHAAESPLPDAFGHKWRDRNLPAPQEPFAWVEIAPPQGGAGAEIPGLTGQDDEVIEIPIGFNFDFYGETKTNVFVCSNGFLTFDSASDAFDNRPIPTPAMGLNGFVGAFWDDLDLGANPADARVYYQLQGSAPSRQLVVEWYRVPHVDDTGSVFTFQAILYEGAGEDEIKVQFGAMSNGASQFADGRSATLGIEDKYGFMGLQYSFGNWATTSAPPLVPGPVSNGLAIRYFQALALPRILVLQETCGTAQDFVVQAQNHLATIGYPLPFVLTGSPDQFLDKLLNAGPWDLLIIDEYSDCLGAGVVSALGAYIAGGGRAIISHWGWDSTAACGGEGGLDTIFEAAFVSDYQVPQNIYRWDLTHPIFSFPNMVPDFTSFTDSCLRDGGRFNAIGGGVPVAGYTTSPQVSQHGIIVGNNNRTILNGEVFDVITGNQDGDGLPDVIELIENEILFLLFPALTTAANPAQHGTPAPYDYGVTQLYVGTVFTSSVPSPADEAAGTRYVCTGWTGSGSVPVSGSTTQAVVTFTQSSTITWQWQAEHYLSLTSFNGQITGTTEGWKTEGLIFDLAPVADPDFNFDHWTVNGLNAGVGVPLSVTADAPKAVVAYFAGNFGDQTSNVTAQVASWWIDRQTGLLHARLQICNRTNSTKTMKAPFWYGFPRKSDIYLWDPDGTTNGIPYVDITAVVNAALPGVGNGDNFLDPGECVIVPDVVFYSRNRVPSGGMVFAFWADPPQDFDWDEAAADTDHDGIANGWEDAHGLCKNDGRDAVRDDDGDGFSALEEFRANTDPADRNSALRLVGIWSSGEGTGLRWAGGTSSLQQLMWSPSASGPWLPIFTNPPVTEITNEYQFNPGEMPAGFYRVTVP